METGRRVMRGGVRGPLEAWVGAAALIGAVAADAALGGWVLLPLLVASLYGGALVASLARPLPGKLPNLIGAGVLWAAAVAALVATAPLWLGWTLWYRSYFLITVGAVFLFLSVIVPAWSARGAVWRLLLRGQHPEEHRRYLASPPRDAATVILLGTAFLTLNWAMLALAGVYLLRNLLRSRPKTPVRDDNPQEPLRPSIVIPTLNEEGNIGPLLSDLERQTRRAYEVIVVDGWSADGTTSVIRSFSGVRLLEGFPPVAEQRNLGGPG